MQEHKIGVLLQLLMLKRNSVPTEMLVCRYQCTWCHIPEDWNLKSGYTFLLNHMLFYYVCHLVKHYLIFCCLTHLPMYTVTPCVPKYKTTLHIRGPLHSLQFSGKCLYRTCLILCMIIRKLPIYLMIY